MKITDPGSALALIVPILAFCAPKLSLAQLTVYSDVAGFDTVVINGTGGGESKLTFAATEFLQTAKYLGVSTAVGADTVTVAGAGWAADEFNGANGSHYLEIVSVNGAKTAAGVGLTRTIVGTSTDTLNLDSAFPAGLAAPIEFRVLSHWTLASIFGSTNTAGLQGGSILSADHVQLWNGTGYESYYYQTSGIGGTGWRKVGNQSADAGGTIIRPDQNVIVKRVGGSAVSLLLNGWAKTGQSSFAVVPGFNFVPNPYAVAMTLATSGLHNGNALTGVVAGNLNSADQVLLWNGTGYETYYYQNAGLGGTGWRKLGEQSTDAGAAKILPGSSVIIRRKNPAGFTWVIPQH